MTTPRILIVGAGAVGQLYGWHLHQAGAHVSFYIRERYLERCKRGFDLFEIGILRRTRSAHHHHFLARSLLTSPEEVATRRWDQIWLTIPSDALAGSWLAPFLAATQDATIICLQPGPNDRELLATLVPPHRIVQGMIAFIAYQGPLPHERLPDGFDEGLVYWHPPLSPSPFGGQDVEKKRLLQVLTLLKAGGCPATHTPDIATKSAFPTAVLMPFLVALEIESWRLAQLTRSPLLELAAKATGEALAIMAHKHGVSPPAALSLYRPLSARAALAIAPALSPLPLEAYLRYHFTKVGAQTRQTMQAYIELGKASKLDTAHLQRLQNAYHDASITKDI